MLSEASRDAEEAPAVGETEAPGGIRALPWWSSTHAQPVSLKGFLICDSSPAFGSYNFSNSSIVGSRQSE